MDIKQRAWLVEILGTYLVVLFGAGAICSAYLVTDDRNYSVVLPVALAEGFALAVAITMTMHLSPTCCNPAITLALWVTKKLEGGQALFLGALQLLGGLLAGLSLKLIFSDTVLFNASFGAPHLRALADKDGATFASIVAGIVIEGLFTFLVTLAAYTSLIDPRGQKNGLLVGLAQAAVVILGFYLTGGAANPARYFGTAAWLPTVDSTRPFLAEHAVYWIGPALGALAGCVFYATVIQGPERKR